MSLRFDSCLEPLESRIAPATLVHPLPDITVGAGQTGTVVDLSKLFDEGETGNYANRTLVTIRTNFDADPTTPGIQGDITIELFDDLAPLTVQNFLRYALNLNTNGDYDGTFFHRAAYIGNTPFVLQGGGFEVGKKGVTHIDSLPEVHNEYDSSRSNERGTIALAKTGSGPNTGTSEWFINLSDNSENLDNQNGGFTVFGRVIDRPGVVDGMEVVDKIAALPTVQGVVGDFPTPVQNYSADPDNNPKTPSPKVNVRNLIKIQDVIVEPSHGGNDAGVTYKSVTVEDVSGDTGLLNWTRNGSDLALSYAPGKAGVAKVTVQVEKDGQLVDESFLVTVQPNLITHMYGDSLPTILVPGDTGKIQLDIVNNGGALAEGTVEVKFYFKKWTKDQSTGSYVPTGTLVDAYSFEKEISIGSGQRLAFSADIQVPLELSSDPGAVYQVIAEIVPKEGHFNSPELYAHDSLLADNTTLETVRLHQIQNNFGTFNTAEAGARTGAVLRYTEPDGDIVEFSIKGPGTGKLSEIADGIVDLQLNGTTAKTQVFAKVVGGNGDGEISIRNIDAITTVGTAHWEQIGLTGNIAFTGGVKQMLIGDLTGPNTISIAPIPDAPTARANLTFGSITDLTLESTMNIGSFRATEWLDTVAGGRDVLIAPALQTLAIGTKSTRGDLQADIELTSSAAVKSFLVSGILEDSRVRIYGNVGTVELGAMHNSSFLVGANERPTSLEGFAEDRTVRKFTIKGLDTSWRDPEDATEQYSFVNSTVAAIRFMNLNLQGAIDFDSGTGEFGVVADVLDRYQRGNQVFAKSLKTPQVFDTATDSNYLVRIV